MIRMHGMYLSFADKIIFDDASFCVNKGDRIGICAPNGSGKTTLFNVIMGQQELNGGSVSYNVSARMAYFAQHGTQLAHKTVRQELEDAFAYYNDIENHISDVESHIAQHAFDEKKLAVLLDRLEQLHEQQQYVTYEKRTDQILKIISGLGFETSDLDKDVHTFSGGWQMRIMLAKILLMRPELMILDEPTNHLDLETRMWFIENLQKHDITLLVISHDRYFLDHTVTSIAELYQGKITVYKGNYSQYELLLSKRNEQIEKQQKTVQQQRVKQEKFIERFRYKATKSRQVQSRIKLLDTMDTVDTKQTYKQVRMQFAFSRMSSDMICECVNLAQQFEHNVIFTGVHCTINRGERVAFLGSNGIGKSSLIRIITGKDKPIEGQLLRGHNIHIGYFSQRAADLLTDTCSIWDYIMNIESDVSQQQRRAILGSLLFHDDDIYKSLCILSGGEKARVLLARLLLVACNVLILDEPTNHLDLSSQNILLHALQEFAGTIIFTTHDRYLLENLANKIVYLSKEQKHMPAKAYVYEGDYQFFVWKREQEAHNVFHNSVQYTDSMSGSSSTVDTISHEIYMSAREKQKQKRQLEKNEATVLDAISECEMVIQNLQYQLGEKEIYTNAQKIKDIQIELDKQEQELTILHEKWEIIAHKLLHYA